MYVRQMKWVNNWDLVDVSASNIVGKYLLDKTRVAECRKGQKNDGDPCGVLYQWARSHCLWERRVSIISTFEFIRAGRFDDTMRISEMLLGDKEDLIHKAVGWMLREVGKHDTPLLELFLQEHYDNVPRTTLRYAI